MPDSDLIRVLSTKPGTVGQPVFVIYNTVTENWVNLEVTGPRPQGLAAHLDYLPKMTQAVPPIDLQFFTLKSTGAKNPETMTWDITYEEVPRPKEEIKAAVANIRRSQFSLHFDTQDALEIIALVLGDIVRSNDGIKLEEEAKARLESLVATTAKLKENRAVEAQLCAQIDAGIAPDITTPWAIKSTE